MGKTQNITIHYADSVIEYVVVTAMQIHESGALIFDEADDPANGDPRTRIIAPGRWDEVEVVA